MKEWHRTVVLIIILLALAGLYVWLRTGYESHILRGF